MGSIAASGRGTERRYRARYRTPEGESRSKTFKRKVDAENFLTEVEHSKHSGAYVDARYGRQTFGEYVERWQAQQVHRETTQEQVARNVRLHLIPTFGDRPLSKVTTTQIQSWVKRKSDTLSPGTLRLCYRCLVSIFRSAMSDRIIVRTPCVGIKLPKVERPPVVPLRPEQVAAIADSIRPRYRAAVLLSAGTGLRQGECFGLTVDRVDFLRKQLRVDRQLIRLIGQEPKLAPPKTKASYRVVPLPDIVVDALARHLSVFAEGPDRLIFTNDHGDRINRPVFSRAWRPAVKAAGTPGAHFHDLRHHYASVLIQAGLNVKVVQERLGHATATETLDTYSHLWPADEDRTRAAIDSVWGSSVSDLCQAEGAEE